MRRFAASLLALLFGSAAELDAAPLRARMTSEDHLDPAGFVRSVQRRSYEGAVPLANATALSTRLHADYARTVGRLPFLRAVTAADGRVAVRLGPLCLLALGPVTAVDGQLGLTERRVEGGLLVPAADRGRGRFGIFVGADGGALRVEVRLEDYRSTIRGTAPRSPLREAIYRLTQLPLHRAVGLRFLEGLSL
ncbi:MAG: hypothetical protein IT371_07580 [Deltaproteobacteria bacterium]|nr:hypothetical protein [Deltaproteobacteria bacterium]